MSIEIVKLKNGNEYPLSPAYRTPIVTGTPLEYPFAYDAEAEGTGSLTIVTTSSGQEVSREEFTLFPLTSRVMTSEELAAISIRGDSSLGEFVIEDAAVMDTNTLVDMFMSMNGVNMNDSFSGLPGSVAATSIDQFVCSIASFSNAATPGVSDTESGEAVIHTESGEPGNIVTQDTTIPVDVTTTVTVPEAGTYWVSTAPIGILASLQGAVSACTYELDPRYYGGGIIKISNLLLATQLYQGQSVNLLAFPRIEEKLLAASRQGIPLAIYFGSTYQLCLSGQLYSGSNSYVWSLVDNGLLTFDASNHTLTYTAES